MWRGRVDLPAACFNQYNVSCVVSRSLFFFDSDFARAISQRFEHGRFLVIGDNAPETGVSIPQKRAEKLSMWSPDELASKLSQDTEQRALSNRGLVLSVIRTQGRYGDGSALGLRKLLSLCLGPALTCQAASRLVQCFSRFGFVPDYECDLMICIREPVPSALRETVGAGPAMENLCQINKQSAFRRFVRGAKIGRSAASNRLAGGKLLK